MGHLYAIAATCIAYSCLIFCVISSNRVGLNIPIYQQSSHIISSYMVFVTHTVYIENFKNRVEEPSDVILQMLIYNIS